MSGPGRRPSHILPPPSTSWPRPSTNHANGRMSSVPDSHSSPSPAPSTFEPEYPLKPSSSLHYDAISLAEKSQTTISATPAAAHKPDWSPLLDGPAPPPPPPPHGDGSGNGGEVRHVQNLSFARALAVQKPKKFTPAMLKLYLYLLVGFLNSLLNGFTFTINNQLGDLDGFRSRFNFSLDKDSAAFQQNELIGVLLAAGAVGNIAGSFFCGPFTDSWGRRWGMFLGGAVCCVGAAVQGLAGGMVQFIVGRVLVGFAIALCATAGPCYVAEMAHPAWRGTLTGLYNMCWSLGALPASWIMYALQMRLRHAGDAQWQLAVWLQCALAGLLLATCLFIPETPRWLFANDMREEATAVLTQYHGEGDRKAPVVVLTFREMVQELYIEGSDKRWWDYSDLYRTRSAWWRNSCIWGMAVCGQLAGNGSISHFMGRLLDYSGVKDEPTKMLYGGIMNVLGVAAGLSGCLVLEKWGRRPVLLTGTSCFIVIWIFMTALTARYAGDNNADEQPNMHGAKATIAFIYIFGLVYSFSYTPLQALYPVECLQYETRAKGMGMSNLIVNIAQLFNSYGLSEIMSRIQWKLYYMYIAWDTVQVIYIYFFFVETKGRTLEEINEIFKAPYPVAKSLERHRIVINQELVSGEFVEMF